MSRENTAISKVLVANRGEIAARVIQTARAMGYKTVAVYSEADSNAYHVTRADEAVYIGESEVSSSYLNSSAILAAARKTGADAIHPGYGFLSENTDFSAACASAGITFIGPDAPAIELMGNKRQAKIAMLAAGVPCIPGYEGADQSDENLMAEALKIGFPVMVKAAAGGGGRGMRQVNNESELAENLKSARSEAANAFGSGELILEKAIIEPRHIEIQVFADRQGNCIYLGERDCSIQRRFQKVVEESPSPFMTPELRKAMGEAAVQAALSCEYVGAGTVEFLVDHNRDFYFLEMNTRLQVEHPVTELVTGVDLVEWQLRIAASESLPLTQNQVELQGHAIEVRLYAEDPENNFLPQTGDILRWQPGSNKGVRIDHGIREGHSISPYYDPMLAKIIACGDDRETARRRLIKALENTVLFGVRHNRDFLTDILQQRAFIAGEATTAFLDTGLSRNAPPNPTCYTPHLATLLFYLLNSIGNKRIKKQNALWQSLRFAPWQYQLQSDASLVNCQLYQKSVSHYQVVTAETEKSLKVLSLSENIMTVQIEQVTVSIHYLLHNGTLYLSTPMGESRWTDITHAPVSQMDGRQDTRVLSVMDGVIIDVLVNNGDQVVAGQTVAVMEAMKMEHSLKAMADGNISEIHVAVGDQVKTRQCLLEVVPLEASKP